MTPSPEEIARMSWQERVLAAMRDGIAEVIAEHKRLRLPLVICRDGRVVHITPEEAEAEFRTGAESAC